MSKVDEYFLNFTDKLAYIELKEDSSYDLLNGLPLPIYLEDLSEMVLDKRDVDNLNLEEILQAMICNIAIDKDFKYVSAYTEILDHYLGKVSSYAAGKGMEVEEKDPSKALLLFRGGYLINPLDKYNSYNYARLLWRLAFEKADEGEDFIKEALTILQDIISLDEDFPLSYYELGNIYANLGEYVKARNYFNKALQKTTDDFAKNDVRERLLAIENNAEIEEAVYRLGKGDNEGAIKILTGLLSKSQRADAYYYLGVCYYNISQYENANLAFGNALDKGADFREAYNDYAVSLFAEGKSQESLRIIKEGLRKFPSDPRLTYNKLQVEISLDLMKAAKEDIDELLTFDDLSDELINNLGIIKEAYGL